MNIFSRRKDDPRNVWVDNETPSSNDALVIPPCELWHSDKTGTNEPKEGTPVNTAIGVDLSDDGNIPREKVLTTSQCWAFMGAVGGAGTTTLAVQMAYELAKQQGSTSRKSRRIADPQICLIDLDFEAGSCIHHLDVEPSLAIEDLISDATRIDTTLAQALISTHDCGVSVLAASNVLGANARVKAETVLALLDAACEMFPYVILDLPRHWQSWSRAAIGGSDFVGLISDLTIPSLYMARTQRTQLVEMFGNEDVCQIILNKYERRSFNNTLRLPDAQIALQCEIFGTLCADQNVTREALNCGEPVGAIRSDSRYTKDSRKLLTQITELTKSSTSNEACNSHLAA